MNTDKQLLYVASIDAAMTGTSSLDALAVLAADGAWEGLLEAAEARQEDDRGDVGYCAKAWVCDADTGDLLDSAAWSDLCHDQLERIYDHVFAAKKAAR